MSKFWNADDWHLYLSQLVDARANFPNGLNAVALKIADTMDEVRTAAPAAEPGDVRAISDEMVTAACATYELVYVDNDRSMEEAMRDALRAALANPAPAQGEPVTALPQGAPDLVKLANEIWADPTFERIYAALKDACSVTRPHRGGSRSEAAGN